MTQTITKYNDRELKISETKESDIKIISYDRILNDIQIYEEKLKELNRLKVEAEKLKLVR